LQITAGPIGAAGRFLTPVLRKALVIGDSKLCGTHGLGIVYYAVPVTYLCFGVALAERLLVTCFRDADSSETKLVDLAEIATASAVLRIALGV
jgi:hypothetical protein